VTRPMRAQPTLGTILRGGRSAVLDSAASSEHRGSMLSPCRCIPRCGQVDASRTLFTVSRSTRSVAIGPVTRAIVTDRLGGPAAGRGSVAIGPVTRAFVTDRRATHPARPLTASAGARAVRPRRRAWRARCAPRPTSTPACC
jgi:hypothetical protein